MQSDWRRGFALLPAARVVDRIGINAEFSVKPFRQLFYSFYLAVCREAGVSVGYNADSDGLTASVPGPAWGN